MVHQPQGRRARRSQTALFVGAADAGRAAVVGGGRAASRRFAEPDGRGVTAFSHWDWNPGDFVCSWRGAGTPGAKAAENCHQADGRRSWAVLFAAVASDPGAVGLPRQPSVRHGGDSDVSRLGWACVQDEARRLMQGNGRRQLVRAFGSCEENFGDVVALARPSCCSTRGSMGRWWSGDDPAAGATWSTAGANGQVWLFAARPGGPAPSWP